MYITNPHRTDGFGAQYQSIIFTILYSGLKNLKFVYRPFTSMDHNNENDPLFLEKKENLINIYQNYPNYNDINPNLVLPVDLTELYREVEFNLDSLIDSENFMKIKNFFLENKKKENERTASIHIRRPNIYDIGDYGYTDDSYFLKTIEFIQNNFSEITKIKIYSQGQFEDFKSFHEFPVEFHLNETIEKTFTDLVLSDVLIMSKGSFSYCAALLNDGVVVYHPFWHKPRKKWIII